MVYRIADNITSPLGMTSAQNYQAVKAGHSALACYSDWWDIPTPFTAALLSSSQKQGYFLLITSFFISLLPHMLLGYSLRR